jgi:hypothetical protein
MTPSKHFSVQPCIAQGREIVLGECIHVEAMSPVQAAELALGESLSIQGEQNRARAKVWRLSDDYSPISTILYRPK